MLNLQQILHLLSTLHFSPGPPPALPSSPTPGVMETEENAPEAEQIDYAGGNDLSGRCSGRAPSPSCAHDLSRLFPTAGNQGAHAACVAFAIGRHLRTFAARQEADYFGTPQTRATLYSAGYMYDALLGEPKGPNPCERQLELHNAIRYITRDGTLPDDQYEYSTNSSDSCKPHTPTPLEVFDARLNRLNREMRRISLEKKSTDEIVATFRSEILEDHPIFVTLRVDWELFRPGSSPPLRNGVLATEAFGALQTTRHALLIVGYDDTKQAFKILNSSGPTWADNGFALVRYTELVSALVQSSVYVMGSPRQATTRVLLNLSANVGASSINLNLKGKFIDYVPQDAVVIVYAARANCQNASCSSQVATQPLAINSTDREFAVNQLEVSFDQPSIAAMRGSVIRVSCKVMFKAKDRNLEAQISEDSLTPTKDIYLQ